MVDALQLLIALDQVNVFNALNFSGVAWMADPVFGPPNQTALATKIAVFLCPSDSDRSSDPYDLGHVNYRGSAGTLPYNLAADSPDGSGRNNGIFWFQSAVRVAEDHRRNIEHGALQRTVPGNQFLSRSEG